MRALVFGLLGCASSGALRADPIEDRIDAIFRAAHDSGKFDGTALVTRKDKTLYERSYGLANIEKSIPNAANTKYIAFSIMKPITATLVFQLIDTGKLHLADALDSFFPNLAGKPSGKLSLQQLLTHTSGIQEVISAHLDRRITPKDLEDAAVKPNAGFAYSSAGYVVLGLVLEAATGKPIEALTNEKIFDPAGMKDSGLLRTGKDVPGLAVGYHQKDGKPIPSELGVKIEALDGSGSFYTTARDLWRFDQALTKETVLSGRMQDLMLTEQMKGRFGYGWFLGEQGGKYFPWHQGSYRGYTAIFVRQIQRGEAIVILSNHEETDVLGLRTEVLKALKANAGR